MGKVLDFIRFGVLYILLARVKRVVIINIPIPNQSLVVQAVEDPLGLSCASVGAAQFGHSFAV
jgi:hypothetical protein